MYLHLFEVSLLTYLLCLGQVMDPYHFEYVICQGLLQKELLKYQVYFHLSVLLLLLFVVSVVFIDNTCPNVSFKGIFARLPE